MTDRFTACVAFVLDRERGFVNDPKDHGGATNRGITIATLSAWRGKPCTVDDVLTLGEVETRSIYKARYWALVRGDKLPPPLDLAVFDAAVNSGPRQAILWLQEALDLAPDGILGPQTLLAAAKADPKEAARDVCRLRLAMIRRISGWSRFGDGWGERILALRGVIGATDS